MIGRDRLFYSGNNEIYKPSVMIRNGSENRGCPNMTTGKVVKVSQES
jgi:hypothetical protein